MKRKSASRFSHDAFLSHASKNWRAVAPLARTLEAAGLKAWVDDADIQFGQLLRDELQAAIGSSRVLVLAWSGAAAKSRWVMAEIITAFHLRRFIIPVVLDATPLPQFLQTSAYLDRRRDRTQFGEKLLRAIQSAPDDANRIPAVLASESPEVRHIIGDISLAQWEEIQAMGAIPPTRAKQIHAAVDKALKAAVKAYPFEPMILNLAGYHRKNAYLLKHWGPIQAGRVVQDSLLAEAERCFFETLCVNPSEASALNGLGSVLMLERELDAAEFFQTRAIEIMKRAGKDYAAAVHDRELIRFYKNEAAAGR